MQSPIKLSDAAMDAIMSAAQPIDHGRRSAFLEAVAHELARHDIIGDGLIFRVVREQQRRFFRPPIESDHHGHHKHVGKYA
jgi:hypothetical protein